MDERHPVHRHGSYQRYAKARGTIKETIHRFLCYVCRRTLSVLPESLLPYRSVSVAQVEQAFDAWAADQRPPPVSEIEKGCLNRAWTRFKQRVPALTATLGQLLPTAQPTALTLWQELRRKRNLAGILAQLAEPFHTSLLGDYRCLKPWPEHPAGGAR